LNKSLLNDKWIIGKIRGEIKEFLESNGDENITYQNLWGTTKTMLKGQFMSAYI
jgi:hypothetical protein